MRGITAYRVGSAVIGATMIAAGAPVFGGLVALGAVEQTRKGKAERRALAQLRTAQAELRTAKILDEAARIAR